MTKALIADDEPHLASYLQARLAALWPQLEICAVAHDGVAALSQLQALRPDIVFLDIRMPGLSGLDVAQALDFPCRVVFVTAYEQFAVAAFERAAVDYLLKPVSDERLQATIARLQQAGAAAADSTALLAQLKDLLPTVAARSYLRWVKASVGSNVRLIAVDDVCYFLATDKYTTVATADSECLIRTSIKDLAAQLDAQQFWQVHRGTLVNARQIVAARHDEQGRVFLRLRSRAEELPVSRAYAHLFRQM